MKQEEWKKSMRISWKRWRMKSLKRKKERRESQEKMKWKRSVEWKK